MLDNNPNVELDMKLLNKFGQNELGKKWNKLSDEKKQAFISRYFSDCDIQETLEETGFNKFSSFKFIFNNPNHIFNTNKSHKK